MWDEALVRTMVLFKKNLEEKPNIGGVIDTVSQIYDGAERLFEELQAADETVAAGVGRLACQQGCSYCCYRQVAVSAAEALAIGTFLRLSLPAAGIDSATWICLVEAPDAVRDRFEPAGNQRRHQAGSGTG